MTFQNDETEIRRQKLIDRELKELVALCIEEEENMNPVEKEFFAKTKILDEIPSRTKTQEVKYSWSPCCIQ